MTYRSYVAIPALALAACAGGPETAGIPEALRAESGQSPLMTLGARGVQVYECRAKKDSPQAYEWVFIAPEAELFDALGKRVGRHYAGPHWESADGSKVVGTVKARVDAPRPGAIPWLLLGTKSDGPEGSFSKVTAIQRINTVGGIAPDSSCSRVHEGESTRVQYTADYVLLAGR
jgi:hypothetical protein